MQRVDLYQPIIAVRPGAQPLVLRVGVQAQSEHTSGGPQMGLSHVEHYVMISALPEEIRRRVEMAIQALMTGI